MPRPKKEKAEKDPFRFHSSKYPFLHMLQGRELQEFYIDELDCEYGRCIGGLKKAWRGYKIARGHDDLDNQQYYASIIQTIQRALGIKVSDFSHIDVGLYDDEFWNKP